MASTTARDLPSTRAAGQDDVSSKQTPSKYKRYECTYVIYRIYPNISNNQTPFPYNIMYYITSSIYNYILSTTHVLQFENIIYYIKNLKSTFTGLTPNTFTGMSPKPYCAHIMYLSH